MRTLIATIIIALGLGLTAPAYAVEGPGPKPAPVTVIDKQCIGGVQMVRTIKTVWVIDELANGDLTWTPVSTISKAEPTGKRCGKARQSKVVTARIVRQSVPSRVTVTAAPVVVAHASFARTAGALGG